MVDDFLKVPGAKVFSVTKHKVTYHDVDPTPSPASENASEEKPLSETQPGGETATIAAAKDDNDADQKHAYGLTGKENGIREMWRQLVWTAARRRRSLRS